MSTHSMDLPKHDDEQSCPDTPEDVNDQPEGVVLNVQVLHPTQQGRETIDSIAIGQESCHHTWYRNEVACNG